MAKVPSGGFAKHAISLLPDYAATAGQVNIPLSGAQYDKVLALEEPFSKLLSRFSGAAKGGLSGLGQGAVAGGALAVPFEAAAGGALAGTGLGAGILGGGLLGTAGGALEGFSKGPEMAKHHLIRSLDKQNIAERAMQAQEAAKMQARIAQAAEEANEQSRRLLSMVDDAVGGVKRIAPWMLLGGAGLYGLSHLMGGEDQPQFQLPEKEASLKTAGPFDWLVGPSEAPVESQYSDSAVEEARHLNQRRQAIQNMSYLQRAAHGLTGAWDSIMAPRGSARHQQGGSDALDAAFGGPLVPESWVPGEGGGLRPRRPSETLDARSRTVGTPTSRTLTPEESARFQQQREQWHKTKGPSAQWRPQE